MQISFVGQGLSRPECVLCTAGGEVFASDWRGGISCLDANGRPTLILEDRPPDRPPLQPNGIALLEDGSFLLADLSEERAGVWRLYPSGTAEPFLLEIEGRPLPPVNFVYVDRQDRVWITVSTRIRPRADDYRPTASSGFIAVVDAHGARIVADDLGYANECRLDPDERRLYVNETFARRLTRFRITKDSRLTDRETVATFDYGTFPDGLAFDVDGGIWIASIVSNRVIRIDPDGTKQTILEDADPEHVAWVEEAFQDGTLGRRHLDTVRSRALKSISSVAFGGPDLRTVYLGCLLGDRIATFRSPVAGLPPVHWGVTVPC